MGRFKLVPLSLSVIFWTVFLLSENVFAIQEYSLDDLYRIALERAEKIKISEEDLYISEMGKNKALAALIPKLSTFYNYTKYSDDKYSTAGSLNQPQDSSSWGLRLDQSFSISVREFTAYGISRETIEKSRYDLFAVRESYLYSVASAYYDVLKSRKTVDISKANVDRLKKHRDSAAIRLKVGEVTKTALLRAEAELSGAQSEFVKAENRLKLVKAVLARVVGIDNNYELKEAQPSVYSSTSNDMIFIAGNCKVATIDCLKENALAERAEFKSVNMQKKIAEEQVKYAKGAYLPTLSIEGVYSKKDDNPAAASFVKESIYGGIKLNFPFFEGGLRKAEAREAESKLRQSELAYEDLKKTIHIEVENAYLDLITQKGILKSLEDQAAFARDNYNAVSRQFDFGLANSLDVMDANTLLVTAERQLIDAQYNYQLSILKLKHSTGTLLKAIINRQAAAATLNKK